MSSLNVIGVPSSAACFCIGLEQAPKLLRSAGLLEALRGAGLDVHDHGDLTKQTWKPDREHPTAQNLPEVVQSVTQLADAATDLLETGERLLVLGGNCTIALGVCAALRRTQGQAAVVYIDRHFDANVPSSQATGAFDWMGMGHAFALEGGAPELVAALGPAPLLEAANVAFLGVEQSQATEFELKSMESLGVTVVSQSEFMRDASQAADDALAAMAVSPFAVHVDMDVIDFVDAPLADSTLGRNSGPTLAQLIEVLTRLMQHPGARVLSIGALNPLHAVSDPASLDRFIDGVKAALTAS